MREINFQSYPYICKASVDCIKEPVLIKIILRIEPFLFQLSPKRFGNIQVRRIRRQKKQIQPSFLPINYPFLDCFGFMYSCIIQNYKCCFTYFKRKLFQTFQNKFRVNIFRSHLPQALILSADKAQTINLIGFFRQNTNLFIRELPTVRNITLAAYMGFISVIKVYCSAKAQFFKFFELFNLQPVMFRHRTTLRAASYTLISSAKL